MTGKELINWIKENKAEDLECVIQYRDSGGNYLGGEILQKPSLEEYKLVEVLSGEVRIEYSVNGEPNCIVL